MNKRKLLTLCHITLGNILLALAVNMLMIPANIIACGSTGLALVLGKHSTLSFSTLTAIISITTFILGYIALGKKFALTTLLSTILYPIFIKISENFHLYFSLTDDTFLQVILAGLMCGLALGLIIQSGASSGGMDIPPLVIQKYLHINVTVTMYLTDFVLLLLQCPGKSISEIIYGLIFFLVVYLTMDRILTTGKSAIQIMVYTQQYEAIRNELLHTLDKGVTMYQVQTGYLKNDQMSVCTIISRKDLSKVKDAIYTIDPDAFMTVSNVQEVHGLHFRPFNQSNLEHFIKK